MPTGGGRGGRTRILQAMQVADIRCCAETAVCGVLQVAPSGQVLRFVADVHGRHITSTSAISDAGDILVIGNLGGNYVSILEKARLPPVYLAKSVTPGKDMSEL